MTSRSILYSVFFTAWGGGGGGGSLIEPAKMLQISERSAQSMVAVQL